MRLDCQILLKSPPLHLLAGSAPAVVKLAGIFTKRIWQPYKWYAYCEKPEKDLKLKGWIQNMLQVADKKTYCINANLK